MTANAHTKSQDCLPETFQFKSICSAIQLFNRQAKQRKQQHGDNVCIDSSCSTFSAEEES